MNSHHLRNKVGRILMALAFMVGIGIASSTAVQAQWPQWPYGQDPYRNRDYRRNDRWDRYGNISQIAVNQGIRTVCTPVRAMPSAVRTLIRSVHTIIATDMETMVVMAGLTTAISSGRPTVRDSCVATRRAISAMVDTTVVTMADMVAGLSKS